MDENKTEYTEKCMKLPQSNEQGDYMYKIYHTFDHVFGRDDLQEIVEEINVDRCPSYIRGILRGIKMYANRVDIVYIHNVYALVLSSGWVFMPKSFDTSSL